MSFSQLAFGFSGRIRRRDFWLGQILLAFVVGFTAVILFPAAAAVLGIARSGGHIPAYVGLIIRSLLLWPALAIAVKRGHDRNRSAAWIVALYAISYAVSVFAQYLAPAMSPLAPWLAIAEVALLAYVVVDLGLLDGSKGADRFGPSPKSPTSGSTAQVIA